MVRVTITSGGGGGGVELVIAELLTYVITVEGPPLGLGATVVSPVADAVEGTVTGGGGLNIATLAKPGVDWVTNVITVEGPPLGSGGTVVSLVVDAVDVKVTLVSCVLVIVRVEVDVTVDPEHTTIMGWYWMMTSSAA